MIVRPKPQWRDVMFAVRGTILLRVLGQLASIGVAGGIAVVTAAQHPAVFARFSALPFALIGTALSIFMSFRNATCYARWWEGRQQWGALIIASRSFARLTGAMAQADREALLRGVCGFTHGLTARLRKTSEAAALAPWVEQDDHGGLDLAAPNPTDLVLNHMGRHLLAMLEEGRLPPLLHTLLEQQLAVLAQVQGACERIANTPVPFAYSLLLHRTAHLFALALPFGLVGTLGWWALLPSLLVGYAFFGMDALGDQLEDPFGLEPNNLPLDAMTRTVEREMLWQLGARDLPPPLQPHDHVLT